MDFYSFNIIWIQPLNPIRIEINYFDLIVPTNSRERQYRLFN